MKTWITQTALGFLATMAIALTSCEKDETKVVLTMGAAPQLKASATTAALTPATAAASAVTYTWTPAEFGYKAGVAYTLQFAKQGTNFATPQEFDLGPVLTKSFTVGELNKVYNGLDCNIVSGVSTRLEVRVKAAIVGGKVDPVYSPLSGIQASPFQAQAAPADAWAIIGSATAGGWGAETPMTYDFCNRIWKITIPLTAAEFKFRANNGWALNLGDDGADKSLEPNGKNIVVTEAGTYDIVLNVNATPKATFTITKR
ncbi:hypothetical protein GCM10022408_03560 [Hymenobacter fastidiosus]|uniref:SusE outer membrane protein domain-containing protein n=1 Tax=Hymenobacter fastidiosus TaxID=486264 RepID=A0ABP7REA7_9BACT